MIQEEEELLDKLEKEMNEGENQQEVESNNDEKEVEALD